MPTPSLMTLTSEQLEEVERYGALLMKPTETALLLGLSVAHQDLFVYVVTHMPFDPITQAYQRGRLRTKTSLHDNIVKLAAKGSPAAQPLAMKLLSDQDVE